MRSLCEVCLFSGGLEVVCRIRGCFGSRLTTMPVDPISATFAIVFGIFLLRNENIALMQGCCWDWGLWLLLSSSPLAVGFCHSRRWRTMDLNVYFT